MVCEKNEGVEHDFEKDPIKLRIIDENIYGTETTLGADNGIAVAMCLAVLESEDIDHPALEVLITTDEEKGMTGAKKVDGAIFKSKYLLNLDSDEEGVFTSGCAGGGEVVFKIPVRFQNAKNASYRLSVKGLMGGHSGADASKERGNANKILGRILYDLFDDVELVSFNGGSKTNAIPREAYAIINIENIKTVKNKVELWNEILKNEYTFTDSSVIVLLDDLKKLEAPLEKHLFKKIITAINLIPNGVLTKSTAIDLVISSNNLGVITTDHQFVTLYLHPRSSVKTLLTKDFAPSMKQLGDALGIECIVGEFYPGWEYAKQSKLRDICIETFSEMFGKEPLVGAVHAGLECGLLMEKIPGLDAISMGPTAWDIHSPNEHLSIKSTENMYRLLLSILKNIK
ncbi:MAG: beta-Ala-His dipeptidase, partial [Sedimentibacter sp.]